MKILAYIFSSPMIQFEMRIKNYREKNRKKNYVAVTHCTRKLRVVGHKLRFIKVPECSLYLILLQTTPL